MSRVLTDAEYEATTAALVRLAGLVFDASRRAAVSAIVYERIERTGLQSVESYLSWVDSTSGAAERQLLLDAVTIQETHFYRNLPQIDALRREVLPVLIARAKAVRRPLTIWSAGCSTGEEPYTLAMLVLELLGNHVMPVRIVGTDVSESALSVAREGVYSGRTIGLAEPGATERWFVQLADGSHSVRQDVRDVVEFRLHNLVTEQPPFGDAEIDLVVCRNVTIYFGRDTTQRLVESFHRCLTPNGYLLLGHAETLWQISDSFSLVPAGEAFVYRKDDVRGRSRRQGSQPDDASSSRAPESATRRVVREVLRVPVRLPRIIATTRTTLDAASARPSPQQDLVAARISLREGRYDEAATLAARATAAQPLLVEGYIVAGRALSNVGDDDGSIVALRKAVFLDPSAAHAHFLLATTLSRVDDPAGAALSFGAAAQTLPSASPEVLAELLDGRAVADLVDLCRQLAAAADTTPEAVVAVGGRLENEAGWQDL